MRKFPLFIIDSSRAHGRGREKDFVACTSKDMPFVAEITLLSDDELSIDQDWQKKSRGSIYSDANSLGIRAKLKVISTPVAITDKNYPDLLSLMRRCLKEWRTRRNTVAVDLDNISDEAVVKFVDTLLEQTRENLRDNPNDSQAYTVGCILSKIKQDYSK